MKLLDSAIFGFLSLAAALNAWKNWGDPLYGQEAKACVVLAVAAGLFAAFGVVYP